MKDAITSAKNILILIPENYCFDTAASAVGLAKLLKNKNRQVRIGSSKKVPQKFLDLLQADDLQFINEIDKKQVVLSLNVKKGSVEAVKWRENDEKVEFVITPKVGDFEYNDVDLETKGSSYEIIIVIGAKTLESCGSIYGENNEAFADVGIINLDTNPENVNFGDYQMVRKAPSLSNLVLDFARENDLELNKEAVETLFKGIFWASEGFRDNVVIRESLSMLRRNKGNLAQAVTKMFDSVSVAEIRYLGKMIANLKVFSDNIVVSKIGANEIQGVDPNKITYPEINVLSRISPLKAAIIISEFKTGEILVRIYSKEIDVFDIFSEYSPIGNSDRVMISFSGTLDEAERKVLDKFKKKEAQRPKDTSKESANDHSSVQKEQKQKETREDSEKGTEMKKDDEKKKGDNEPLKKANKLPKAVEAPPITPVQPQTQYPAASQIPTRPLQPR